MLSHIVLRQTRAGARAAVPDPGGVVHDGVGSCCRRRGDRDLLRRQGGGGRSRPACSRGDRLLLVLLPPPPGGQRSEEEFEAIERGRGRACRKLASQGDARRAQAGGRGRARSTPCCSRSRDMQGRLQGKRLTARHFLDDVVEHGAEGCNYLLAVDVDMKTVDGYAMASWERGYGDFEMVPDLDTLRPVPWQPGTVLCSPTSSGPTAARRRLAAPDPPPPARPAGRARLGRERRHRARVHRLPGHLRGGVAARATATSSPANLYNVDYSLLGTARVEPLIRRIRNEMGAAGHDGRGLQGRVQPRPARDQLPLQRRARRPPTGTRSTRTAPRRSPPRRSMAITFMAKFNEREGSSCHIHLLARATRTTARTRSPPTRRCSSASSPGSSPACGS